MRSSLTLLVLTGLALPACSPSPAALPGVEAPPATIAPSDQGRGLDLTPEPDDALSDEEAAAHLGAHWYDDVLVSDDAWPLRDAPCFEGVEAVEPTSVTLNFSCDASATGLRPGHILVGGPGRGLLRRVDAVSFDGAQAHLTTTPAQLLDVVFEGSFRQVLSTAARDGLELDLSGTVLFDDAVSPGFHALVEVPDATLTIDPQMILGADIGRRHGILPVLESAEVGLAADAVLALEVHADLAAGTTLSGTQVLGTFDVPFSFDLGPLPIQGGLDLRAELIWDVTASAATDARAGADVTAHVAVGSAWSDGAWTPLNDFTWEATLRGPDLVLDGSWDARLAVRLTAALQVLESVSLDAALEPWASTAGSLDCAGVDWEAAMGLDTDGSVDLSILSFALQRDWDATAWQTAREGHIALAPDLMDPSCLDGGLDGDLPTTDEPLAEASSDVPWDAEPFAPIGDVEGVEDCGDGLDDDADGAVDCADTDCAGEVTCGSECQVWMHVGCGQIVRSTTDHGDLLESGINCYPVAPGVYSGAELGVSFLAETTGTVTFGLLDAQPMVVDHDVFALASPDGACKADQAIDSGPNAVSISVVAGDRYVFVIDGYNGAAGEFVAEVTCSE